MCLHSYVRGKKMYIYYNIYINVIQNMVEGLRSKVAIGLQ